MKTRRTIWTCITCLCTTLTSMSQVTVSGTVKDSSGEPIVSAIVKVQETHQGTVTDINGHYTIVSPADGSLVFSQVGYEKQIVSVKGRQSIDVILKESTKTRLAEIVSVGYSTVERRDLTGSVSTVKMPESKSFLSLDQLLAGQAAGGTSQVARELLVQLICLRYEELVR